ncbi:MAG: hypothetical protein A2001_01585 [Treponema sp. GWC1_61_84]|nr:MAG: hypothetical protein A2001_01585 [Treponema sp. GWC1_61_84]
MTAPEIIAVIVEVLVALVLSAVCIGAVVINVFDRYRRRNRGFAKTRSASPIRIGSLMRVENPGTGNSRFSYSGTIDLPPFRFPVSIRKNERKRTPSAPDLIIYSDPQPSEVRPSPGNHGASSVSGRS